MKFDSSSLTLEGLAGVILAVGLVSAFFFGSNSKAVLVSKSHEVLPQSSTQKPGETSTNKKKKKKGKNEAVQVVRLVDDPQLPGGNENFPPTTETNELAADDLSLVAPTETDAAAREQKKQKKQKKKARDNATKQTQASQPVTTTRSTEPKLVPIKKKGANVQHPVVEPDVDDEWRVVGRSRRANTTADSQASFTTTSATDPGSPKEEGSPAFEYEIKGGVGSPITKFVPEDEVVVTDRSSKLNSPPQISTNEEGIDLISRSLVNSRDFGLSSDHGGEESTEDDGFIPVKSKGRKRIQRSASTQSVGGSGGIRASESMNKKQRQNKAKRDVEKAARIEGEQQRQETLAHHKKELENARISQMYKKGKQLSGGMSMSIGSSGKGEWD